MRRVLTPLALLICGCAVALLSACSDDNPVTVDDTPRAAADAVPDFSMVDVNATSPTADKNVSPRDHLGHLSAWYFGHST